MALHGRGRHAGRGSRQKLINPFYHRHGRRAEAGQSEAEVIVQNYGCDTPLFRWIHPLGARIPAASGIMVRISCGPTAYE